MRSSVIAAVSGSTLVLLALGVGVAAGDEAARISGPVAYDNLAVYFIHGKSAPGKVPLTLDEALAKGTGRVLETGDELQIKNLGDDEVFVQSGDIVKGGRPGPDLMVSLILPPRSGRIPIASFCVEQGRWSGRGGEAPQGGISQAASAQQFRRAEMKACHEGSGAGPLPPVDPGRIEAGPAASVRIIASTRRYAAHADTASRQQQGVGRCSRRTAGEY